MANPDDPVPCGHDDVCAGEGAGIDRRLAGRERCWAADRDFHLFHLFTDLSTLPEMSFIILLLMGTNMMFSSATSFSGCIQRDLFGSYRVPERGGVEMPVYRYTLTSGQVTAQVVEYGATLTSVKVPDRWGRVVDVVLGYDSLTEMFSPDNPYFGSTVGRVANRIGGGEFTVDGVKYRVSRNLGNDTLHGGFKAFDKKLWSGRMEGGRVLMEYTSEDGEEGFPGRVTVVVAYSLLQDNTLVIEYKATSSKRTPINLTNHAYFNLAGHGAGATSLYNHTVNIRADYITETNSDFIPTGKLTPVNGTEFDLRQPSNLGAAIKKTAIDGFDNNFVLPEDRADNVVAVVEDPGSGRRLEVRTTQPGLQFYTSNSISSITGKGGQTYTRHAAFCLEAQNFPDAVNHQDDFPNAIYGPGDVYHQVIQYKF